MIFFPPHKVMKPLIMRFLRRILCWKLFNFPLRRGKAPLLRQVQLYYVVGSRSILPEEVKRGLHCSMNVCSHSLLFLCTLYQRIIYDRISNWKKPFKIPEIKIQSGKIQRIFTLSSKYEMCYICLYFFFIWISALEIPSLKF